MPQILHWIGQNCGDDRAAFEDRVMRTIVEVAQQLGMLQPDGSILVDPNETHYISAVKPG